MFIVLLFKLLLLELLDDNGGDDEDDVDDVIVSSLFRSWCGDGDDNCCSFLHSISLFLSLAVFI